MSLPRPSGLKAPSKIARASALPATGTTPKSGIPTGIPSTAKAQNAIAKSARAAGLTSSSAERYAAEILPLLRGPESDSSSIIIGDDFRIGDRVWVGGSKPGIIAFIGDTQFAPGEWAGVVLDDPVGKNDGSVMGIRYFQCEVKRGVFSRLSKLTKTQQQSQASDSASNSTSTQSINTVANQAPATNGVSAYGSAATSPTARPTTPRLGLGGSRAPSGSSSSLHKASPPTSTTNLHQTSPSPSSSSAGVKPGLKIGDRVLVSGSKPGVLKYVGETDFAKGVWAGVELDEALGKNDGAVAGKRYFDCKAMHGLFAPVHKITRLAGAMSLSTPSPQSRSLTSGLRSARERSGSQESVSSISSSASSVSRSRVRLGVTSLANQTSKPGQRPSTLNLSATTAALQKALKEKEEHIEQLLRERDLERSEVARAAAQVDEAEVQLTSLRTEQERFRGDAEELITRLKAQISDLEKQKEDLSARLEDEKRRVEDLQFQIEEEVICKDDLETTKEEDELRMRELEKNYSKEKAKASALEKELEIVKSTYEKQQVKLKTAESSEATYLDQIEELTHKLSQAESRIKQFETARLQEGAKVSQSNIELQEKMNKINELEDMVNAQRKELKHAHDQLQEVQEELLTRNARCQKLEECVEELTNKVQAVEVNHSKVNDELRTAKSNTSDLQRQLAANKEKNAELTEDRNRLEQQIADLMKNSGDNSKQLSTLNEQLAEKTRRLGELQNDLLSSSQRIAKLNETLEEQLCAKEKEKEGIVYKFEEQLKSVHSQLEDMHVKLDKSQIKLTKVKEEGEKEQMEMLRLKEAEIQQLRERLEAQMQDMSKQELQMQAHKEYLEKQNALLETLKFEKVKAEKALKRVEGEWESLNTELIQARVDVSKMQSQSSFTDKEVTQMREQIDDLKEQVERSQRYRHEAEKERDHLLAEKEKLTQEREKTREESMVLKAEMQKRDIQIEEIKKEHVLQMEKLRRQTEETREELMQRSQTEADMLTEELEGSKKILHETQACLQQKEAELVKLKTELELSKLKAEERQRLEEQKKELLKNVEELKESHRLQVASLQGEKTDLLAKVEISVQELSKQQQFIEEQNKQLHQIKEEKQKLLEEKSSLEKLQHGHIAEQQKLVKSLTQLEAELIQAKKSKALVAKPGASSAGEPDFNQQREGRDAAEKEIEFLNSVIVDLQRKNQEVTLRLQAMEESGICDGLQDGYVAVTPSSRSRPAPRLFCDICDEFDLHDTDDCPQQAMSDSPPPSLHHGDRKSLRPYCEICEYFIDPDALDKHTHSKMAGSFFHHCVGFFSDEEMDEDIWKSRPQKTKIAMAPASPQTTPDSPEDTKHQSNGVGGRSRTPVLVLSSGEEDDTPTTIGSQGENEKTVLEDLSQSTSEKKSELEADEASGKADGEKWNPESLEATSDVEQVFDDAADQLVEALAPTDVSRMDSSVFEGGNFESLGFTYARCESLGFDVEGGSGEPSLVLSAARNDSEGDQKEEAKTMSDDEFIMSKEELEDNEKHELERESSDDEARTKKNDLEPEADSAVTEKLAETPDVGEKEQEPRKITKENAASAKPDDMEAAALTTNQKPPPPTPPTAATPSCSKQGHANQPQATGGAPSNERSAQAEAALKGDNPEAGGKCDKGDKSEVQQEKAKKRASAGATLGGNEKSVTESSSERPESCTVS
ncbi:CAP-Gly domain-containing linker protein 1-like isoform X4 [Pomacea canaliculata]|uniref:CAP-Gly domain-containing linker protein 1-like isoform X4 n=1 Tax=Pomacea canaliculata TaxID=400727 RepID=UPI000D72AD60|nr:CAP-Gly domain-containing linker protein 1-like isoform X4 [Pomacea canaliculata]